MKNRCQVLVIGAGPAGGFAARTLARSGLDVIILERDQEIGRPLACAEGISHAGLSNFLKPDPSFYSTEINSIAITVATGHRFTQRFPETIGYVLDRPRFDQHIVKLAQDNGARLYTETAAVDIDLDNPDGAVVRAETREGQVEFRADYVIAADGVESMIGRRAGIATGLKLVQCETALQHRVSGIAIDANTMEFCVGKSIAPGGYLWIFPKSDSSANIGLGLNPAKFRGRELEPYLLDFLKDRFTTYCVDSTVCGMVPKFIGFHTLGKKNLVLVGDAARTIDSMAGAGISKALHTGLLAAEAIIDTIQNNRTHDALQQLYLNRAKDGIGSELTFGQRLYPVLRKFSDRDWEILMDLLREQTDKQKTGSFDPVAMIQMAIKNAPQLLRMARHLF